MRARPSSSASGGSSSLSEARPYFMRFAMRFMSTVVLPLPAPARMSSGPSVARTASRWRGLRLGKLWAITCRRASM